MTSSQTADKFNNTYVQVSPTVCLKHECNFGTYLRATTIAAVLLLVVATFYLFGSTCLANLVEQHHMMLDDQPSQLTYHPGQLQPLELQ